MADGSDVLRRKHGKVCEVLDISEPAFRSLVGRLFSVDIISATTKAAVLRKMGHEGADKLMDVLEMKVDAKPERLKVILEIMFQEESLRDIFDDTVQTKPESLDNPTSIEPLTDLQPIVGSNPTNSLIPQSNSFCNRDLDEEGVDRLRQLINKIIEQFYSKLHSAISGALPHLVRMLYEDGLIGKELLSDHDYDKIMKSFLSTLDWDSSVEDLEKDCTKFVRALDRIGGPARKAGERISCDLKKAVHENFGFDFKTP